MQKFCNRIELYVPSYLVGNFESVIVLNSRSGLYLYKNSDPDFYVFRGRPELRASAWKKYLSVEKSAYKAYKSSIKDAKTDYELNKKWIPKIYHQQLDEIYKIDIDKAMDRYRAEKEYALEEFRFEMNTIYAIGDGDFGWSSSSNG